MRWMRGLSIRICFLLAVAALGASAAALAQVSPAEITNSRLKRAEQTYFEQLVALNRAISRTKLPFPFALERYVGLDPKQQIGADQRGLEFIHFQKRLVLKISGDYNAAFSARLLTQNQRANRVLDDVVVPILRLLPQYFSPQSDFDGIGFEVGYHVRTDNSGYAYEGKEVLSIVFDKADAFQYAQAPQDSARQEMLDRSQVYVDGNAFGLMLGMRDAVPVDEEEKEAEPPPAAPPAAVAAATPAASTSSGGRFSLDQGLPSNLRLPGGQASAPPPQGRELVLATTAATPADADALQKKYQAQLQALDQAGRAHDHFVDYAPPSFVVFRKQIYLQLTLRNPAVFDPHATSIYKRAAQSFDLFLAPRLKALLAQVPDDAAIAGVDVTVLTEFAAHAGSSSEAIEFACPMALLRQFTDAEITNQDLVNQSVVLVNGVRIALDLQRVE